MKRFGIGILGAAAGYVTFAFVGYFMIGWLSSNAHDRSVEAAMTSVFALGPLGALAGLAVGLVLGGRAVSSARTKS